MPLLLLHRRLRRRQRLSRLANPAKERRHCPPLSLSFRTCGHCIDMLDFTRFEVLTFDCYGTLINWEEGILRCLHRVLAAHGKDTDDAAILGLYADFEARAEQGEYRRYREVLQSVVRQFGEQLGFAPAGEEARSLPESMTDWQPWPDP